MSITRKFCYTKPVSLTEFQFKEIAKYWFDLSKLTFGSLILKLFESGMPEFTIRSFLIMIWGLTAMTVFASLGVRFAKEVKTDD